jgi:hypothetical protein
LDIVEKNKPPLFNGMHFYSSQTPAPFFSLLLVFHRCSVTDAPAIGRQINAADGPGFEKNI